MLKSVDNFKNGAHALYENEVTWADLHIITERLYFIRVNTMREQFSCRIEIYYRVQWLYCSLVG
jgi:hypothetical protein